MAARCRTDRASPTSTIRRPRWGVWVLEKPRGSYASVSQLSLAASCGEAYRRRYVEREDDPSGLPAEAGSAVHEAIEVWESSHLDDPYTVLPAPAGREIHELAKQYLRAVPGVRELRYWGKQDADWWFTEGLKTRVDNYITHRSAELSDGWHWWGGVPVPFELELEVSFADHNFRAIVDQALVDPRGRLVIRDLKCGREKPWHSTQLEFYILAVRQRFDVHDVYGQVLYLNGKKPKVRVVPPVLAPENADRMVGDLVAMIDSNLHPVTGPFTGACEVCSFRADCPWGSVGQSNTRLRKDPS